MQVSPINNTNFNARIEFSPNEMHKMKLHGNVKFLERWKNIADIFEKNTKKREDVKLNIIETHDNSLFIEKRIITKWGNDFLVYIKSPIYDRLLNLTDEELAEKLNKIMNISDSVESNIKLQVAGKRFAEKHGLKGKALSLFEEAIKLRTSENIDEQLAQDEILHGVEFHI